MFLKPTSRAMLLKDAFEHSLRRRRKDNVSKTFLRVDRDKESTKITAGSRNRRGWSRSSLGALLVFVY
jgi:hypothetical protein